MATTSVSSGLATGSINVDSIVSGLMTIARQPLDQLNKKQTSYQSKITALGTLTSKVDALQTAAKNLGSTSASSLLAFKASASDSTVLSASASSTAAAGTYSVSVTSLAKAQQLVATGQTSSTASIGTGTASVVTFDFGTISGGTLTNGVYTGATFTSNGSGTQTITIDSTNNTLEGIRDAINAKNMGVTASIVNDGSGTPYRLTIASNSTGASNSIKITTDGADATIAGLLTNDPAGTQTMQETLTAKNAQFTVNGIAISKASNTVTDAIQGVSLTLSKENATASLDVARDTAGAQTAVSSFVTAYNDLYTAMKNTTNYKSGSALAGDRTLQSLQTQMREIAATAATGGTLANLFEVGVSFKADGTMQLDSAKLSSAMSSNFNDVAALFNGTSGFATRFESWASGVTGAGGTFESQTNNWKNTVTQLTTQIDAMNVRMTSLEKMYRQQYSALNSVLANMSSTSSYLSQQLTKTGG